MIEVVETGPGKGLLRWQIYCSQIEGEKYQIVMPLILPPINEESIKALSPIIGGTSYEVKSYSNRHPIYKGQYYDGSQQGTPC